MATAFVIASFLADTCSSQVSLANLDSILATSARSRFDIALSVSALCLHCLAASPRPGRRRHGRAAGVVNESQLEERLWHYIDAPYEPPPIFIVEICLVLNLVCLWLLFSMETLGLLADI